MLPNLITSDDPENNRRQILIEGFPKTYPNSSQNLSISSKTRKVWDWSQPRGDYRDERAVMPGLGWGPGTSERKWRNMKRLWNLLSNGVSILGLCRRLMGRESTCRQDTGFDSWVGKIPWRAWQPTLVFLSGESHGQRSLAGYSL